MRSAIASANVNQAKGSFDGAQRASTIDANDQLRSAAEYQNLIIAWKNGNPLRLSDVAQIVDDAENLRLAAWADTTPGVILNVQRQPGANVIQTVDRVKALCPSCRARCRRPSTCRSWPTAPPRSAPRSTTPRSSCCSPSRWWWR
nr:efflux RND transporter permease subunit [Mitsuaria sp. TWR114]